MANLKTVKINMDEYKQLNKDLNKLKKYIKQFANKFIANEYNLNLNIPIKFKYANWNVAGYFRTINDKENDILFNTRIMYYVLITNDYDYLHKYVKHELIHYALFMLNRNYKDGDNEFEQELMNKNSVSSGFTKNSQRPINADSTQHNCFLLDVYKEQSFSGHGVQYKTYKHTQSDKSNIFDTRVNVIFKYE